MKTCAVVAPIMAVFTLGPALLAQQCTSPITSFRGNYSLSGSGSTDACGTSVAPATCTTNSTATGTDGYMFWSGFCSHLTWNSNSTPVVTSVKVKATQTSQCQAKPPIEQMNTWVGTTLSRGYTENQFVTLNLSKGTYSFEVIPAADATLKLVGCVNGTEDWSPFLLFPGTNWPQTFTLPSFVQPLDVSNFSFQGATFPAIQAASWTFSFTLDPTYNDDDDCQQKSDPEQPRPVSSSVGCQNQSLGEDVPVAGTGFNLHYESDRAAVAGGNPVASADAAMIGGWALSVHHAYDPSTNTLFLGDGSQRNGYQLGTPVNSITGNLLLTSEDGNEVYEFDGLTGLHLQTLRPLTGALKYTFGYDAAGMLVTVTDATGNVTTIKRDASEHPTAITSPFGQTTTLAVDSNGFLSHVTDPLGKSATFTNTSAGLLTSRKDANGNKFTYTYDGSGKLSKDADPLGGFTALTPTKATSGFGSTVDLTTALGRTSSHQRTLALPWVQTSTSTSSEQRTITWPDGLQATSSKTQQGSQLSKSVTLPDGTSDSTTQGPDPVWGLQAPVTTSEMLTQGNLTMNMSESRSTTLGTAGDPFSVTKETDTQTINGRAYTSVFTGSTRTWLNTSPAGRPVTIGLDLLERLASIQIGGLTATDFTYDSRGRLATATQGTRKTTLGYNAHGFLSSFTDPLNRTTAYSYDADGHLLKTTLPDGRFISYTYDANGNRTSVTPPGKSAHDFAYNAVDLPEAYTPPAVAGTGATTYGYNLDRDLTSVSRPDGEKIIYGYDTAGRLDSIGTPTGTTTLTYDSTTGNLATAANSTEQVTYSYNGPLPTESVWTGTVAGSVSRSYNDNFWVTSQSVGGGSNVAFQYDNDGLLTGAGALTITRNSQNGLISGTTLDVTTDSRTYNSFGELVGYTASVKGAPEYAVTFTRDAGGRVEGKTEKIGAVTNTYTYKYDLAGRLTAATKNTATDTYTYDSNSNRLSLTTSAGKLIGAYDDQDRLLTYGTASYTYTANGELATQTVGTQKTLYTYDVPGNLIAVTLPNGTKITYIIDAKNRRVGKEVNGVLKTGFLYNGELIVAELNGSNQLASRFVYATGSTSPDYMVRGGVTYRIFSDHLGSPVLVVNATTGAIAEQITYDEFGNVLADTNPDLQPFRFAGGLYDQGTKLVRFGARDFNPNIGRWTAKDPVLFAGLDTNLYGYDLNDPVNTTDPEGTGSAEDEAATKFIEEYAKKSGQTVEQLNKAIRAVKCVKPGGGSKILNWLRRSGNLLRGVEIIFIEPELIRKSLRFFRDYSREACQSNPMGCQA